MQNASPATVTSAFADAFGSLLAFTLQSTGARRGTLSIADTTAASLRAHVGFASSAQAAAFAASGTADRTEIPLDEFGLLRAIVLRDRESGTALLPIGAATATLLARQTAALLEASCVESDLTRFRHDLSSIVDNALAPFVSMDHDGIIREWNAAATATFGWTREVALGKRAADLIVPPELRSRHSTAMGSYRAGARSNVVGKRVMMPAVHCDGTRLVIEMRVAASETVDGAIVYHSFIHDVTDLEQTRERLSRSERLLREAQAIASIGSYEHDLRTGSVVVSDQIYRIVGLDPADPIVGIDALSRLVHPDDLASARALYWEAVRERRSFDFEYRMLPPNGGTIIVRGRGYTVTEDDEPISVLGTVQDITAQRRGELERRELESRFREAFDNAPVGISIIGADPANYGRFIRVNAAFCALLGLAEQELIGQDFTAFTVAGDEPALRDTTATLLGGSASAVRSEVRMIRCDGRIIWVSQSCSLMRDGDGRPVCFFAHVEDITQQRDDRAALAQANDRLQRWFDDAPIGMALLQIDGATRGKFIEVNPALCRITGYPRATLARMSLDDLVHPHGRERVAEAMTRLVERHDAFAAYEERSIHADGRFGWISVHATIVYDDAKRPLSCIAQFIDVTQRKEAELQLERLASHDGLTGVLNRRGLSLEIARNGNPPPAAGSTALLLLDLDHFKYVNDTMGHAAGDRILRKVARTLERALDARALIARLGGDQFLILLPDAGPAEAIAAADRARATIEAGIYLSSEAEIRATASIGIATFTSWTEHALEEAIAAADSALVTAKAQGRNRSIVASTFVSGHAAMRDEITWTQRIRYALEHDRFTLYGQPILNLRTNRIERYELLLRMLDEDGTARLPGEFLPIAERAGLIHEIDCWVVGAAVAIARGQEATDASAVFEINLSGASLNDTAGVSACIEDAIDTSGVNPRSLVFEITETAAIENMDQARAFAERISALGCAFALDDFGAGFSSFYYLKYLPFSDLKIDGEFIRNLRTDGSDQHIVRAIVELARGLGKSTIAEFVGDAETAALLHGYGVDYAQGYSIGVPIPWIGTGPGVAQRTPDRRSSS